MGGGRILLNGHPNEVIDRLKGSVYAKVIDRNEVQKYEENHQVLFSTLVGGRTKIHVMSEQDPGEDFEATSASLEDVYFSTLHEHKIQIAA